MKILVACEYSGVVRDAFRLKGHDAWSCDILPCDADEKYHYQCDIFDIIDKSWDMMIACPPCTYLSVSGNRWFLPKYAERYPNRQRDREDAVEFFMKLANAPIEKICIENSQGIMSTRWRKPNQIIHPYQFGHPVAKRTCLWLKNLPPVMHTTIVEPEYETFPSGKRVSKWYMNILALNPPLEERRKLRSKTFKGIAMAFANQWG